MAKQEALETAARLKGASVTIKAKAGKEGKLFGSVTAGDVADAVSAQLGVDCPKKKIALESEIKAFGTYSAQLKLMAGISQKITVNVTEE